MILKLLLGFVLGFIIGYSIEYLKEKNMMKGVNEKMRTYEEFKKDYDGWKKDDVLNTYYEMLEVFRIFERFIKVKYGDDYLNGWLHFLRTGEMKDEESNKEH